MKGTTPRRDVVTSQIRGGVSRWQRFAQLSEEDQEARIAGMLMAWGRRLLLRGPSPNYPTPVSGHFPKVAPCDFCALIVTEHHHASRFPQAAHFVPSLRRVRLTVGRLSIWVPEIAEDLDQAKAFAHELHVFAEPSEAAG